MRGDHVLVILIVFSFDHIRGEFLSQPKAFYMEFIIFIYKDLLILAVKTLYLLTVWLANGALYF